MPVCGDFKEINLGRSPNGPPCNTPPSPSPPARAAHFDKLAIETIEAIFSHACTNISLPRKHLDDDAATLSMVCRKWQTITKGYHPLWASLDIFCAEKHRKMWGQSGLDRLHDYLNRSGAYPLKLCIAGGDWNEKTMFPRIFAVVALHSNRWKSFRLTTHLQSDYLHKFNVLKGRLPLLEYFSMNMYDERFYMPNPNRQIKRCTAFPTAPLLRRVQIRTKGDEDILLYLQLPWSQISEFTISEASEFRDKMAVRRILASLAFSSSLTTLAFRYTLHSFENEPFSIDGNPVLLASLRELCFVNSTNILGMMVCPSLEKLEIGHADPQELATFLNNSSCCMKHFRLNFSRHHLEFDAAMQSSSLSTLKSVSLVHPTNLILNLFISDARNLFHSLETLYVELQFTEGEDDAQHLTSKMETLHKIVESRTQIIHPNFCGSPFSNDYPSARDAETSPRSSLKSLSFVVHLGGKRKCSSEKKQIRKFESLCDSRNVVVDVKILQFPPARQ